MLEYEGMLWTILGFVAFLLPFSAVLCFESRVKGILTVLVAVAAFHLSVALAAQSFHVFTYPIVLSLHIVFGLAALYFAFKYKVKSESKISFNWFAICSFIIVFALLVSLHYYYTGIVDTGNKIETVTKDAYTYPFFSDEWVAVALVNYSIRSGSLPFVNPLNADSPFPNFLAGFHSFISEIILLLGLHPLTQYIWLAIANGMLVCFLVYKLLRLNGVGVYASSVAILSIPFITNSGNLPGIINLLPYSLSLSFLLLGILGFFIQSRVVAFLAFVISLIIYPPMIVFVAPVLIAIYLHKEYSFFKLSKKFCAGLLTLAALLLIVLFAIKSFSLGDIFARAASFIVRADADGATASFRLWDVIPLFLIPFVLIGAIDVWKRKLNIIILPVALGSLLWICYSFTPTVFLIELPRVVSITSIFLVIASGFGLEKAIRYFGAKYGYLSDAFVLISMKVIVLAFFVLLSVFYSKFSLHHKLTLVVKNDNGEVQGRIPSPPITRYLSNDDLRLFESIKGKRFISPRWKGLVVGVATGNYPLDSKASTMTTRKLAYDDFMLASCAQKELYAKKFKIDYAYSREFSCDGFKEIGKSDEGLVLYKYNPRRSTSGGSLI